MKKILLFLISIGSALICFPQYINYQKTFGGNDWEYGYTLRVTTDGGYIVGGVSRSTFTGNNVNDAYLVKMNVNGNLEWDKAYGTQGIEVINDVCQTRDGGYLFGGYSYQTPGSPLNGAFVVKVNSSGDTLWSRIFNFRNSGGDCYALTEANDSNYIIADYTPVQGGDGFLAGLIKLDPDGDTIWTRTYDGAGDEWIYGIDQTHDGGYILSGYTTTGSAGGKDFLLIKVDPAGNLQWQKAYGGAGDDVAFGHSVRETDDHGFIILGETKSFSINPLYNDFYLVKTDSLGNPEFSKTYGGMYDDVGHSIQIDPNGGFILTGWTKSFGAGISNSNENVWLIKTDSSGDTIWTRVYGGAGVSGTGGDLGYDIKKNSMGYLLSGRTTSFGSGTDIYLIQTDFEGNTGCNQYAANQAVIGNPVTLVSTPVLQQSAGCQVIHPSLTMSSGGSSDSLCILTGEIKLIKSEPPVMISPNPFDTETTLHFSKDCITDHIGIRIMNVSGQEVKRLNVHHISEITIPREDLASGVYFLIISSDQGIITVRKIVVI